LHVNGNAGQQNLRADQGDQQRGLADCHAFSCYPATGLLGAAHAKEATGYDPMGEWRGQEPPLHAGTTWWGVRAPHPSVSGICRQWSGALGSSCNAIRLGRGMELLLLRGLGCGTHGVG
jgi:hypothetical protein